jgi:prepilin peptidase CpaA
MLYEIVLLPVLAICFFTDFKYQKIYNKVIYPAIIISIILNVSINGLMGLKTSLTGFVVGLCILLIPYLMGGIGAGDVKLLAFIGALKGSIFVLNTALYMALIGGVIALVMIILSKESKKFFKGFWLWLKYLFFGIRFKLEIPTTSLLKKYPYGLAIVGGSIICLLFKEAMII